MSSKPFALPNASPEPTPSVGGSSSPADPSSAGGAVVASVPPAVSPAEVAAEKERADRLEKQLRESQVFNQQLALQLLQRTDATPRATGPPEPDRDSDPEAHTAWLAEKRANELLDKKLAPLIQGYAGDRTVFLESAVAFQKSSVRSTYPDFDKFSKEIDSYLSLFPAEVVARPGAIEDAYFRVKGRATAVAERDAATRAAAVADPRGRSSASVGDDDDRLSEKPKLTEQQLRIYAREGLTDEDISSYRPPPGSIMTIDDYLAAKSAKSKKGAA